MGTADPSSEFIFHGTAYVQGKTAGRLLVSNLELSFWGGVDPQTGEIIDRHHTLSGQFLQGTVLAIPGSRGSCSGSGVMLELLLNGKGPEAILFERREDILTLGVMISDEVFGKAIPVLKLKREDFLQLSKLGGKRVHINGNRVSGRELTDARRAISQRHEETFLHNVELSDMDRALLDGLSGEAARISMRIVLRMAELLGVRELMNVTQVHVDGCIYTGPGSLAFAEKLRDLGGKVLVPTTLNSISIDQERWQAQGVDYAFGEAARKLADAYIDMDARPTFTCAPYQLDTAPKRGDQIAWAESNAVVYANSVLGARTMKYPDFLDISVALTGSAPKGGIHLDINRLASLCVRISSVKALHNIDDSFYPLLGYHVGTLAPSQIPVIVGMERLVPSNDDLKAFGAAFATTSSAPMFHIVGVTPEATTLDAVVDKHSLPIAAELDMNELNRCWHNLNSADEHQFVDLISLGNPHFSFAEIKKLAGLCRGREKHPKVAVVVTCGRAIHGLASQAGLVHALEQFGVQFVTDTCWCMIVDPVIPRAAEVIMTNSGKYAHYGPGLTGRRFYFGSLAACVETACRGLHMGEKPQWLLDAVRYEGNRI